MFEEMMEQIRFNITKIISFVEIKTESEQVGREQQEEIKKKTGTSWRMGHTTRSSANGQKPER